jgi:hypothetical protein
VSLQSATEFAPQIPDNLGDNPKRAYPFSLCAGGDT